MSPLTQEPSAETADTTKRNGNNGTVLVQDVPIAEIVRSPFNREVDTKSPAFAELVDSIRQHGVIQPGLARPLTLDMNRKPGAPRFELVVGEHRWLASQVAKRATMPVIVRQLTDLEAIELQAVENDKRKDLSPIEEAEKYQQLIGQYEKAGAKKEDAVLKLCEKLSKGKSTVYEALRLLQLSPAVKTAVNSGALPSSHAGLIAKLPVAAQPAFAKIIAPGKALTYQQERQLEQELGVAFNLDVERDETNGLISFRDAKEIVDAELENIATARTYELKAVDFRNKGGVALTWAEARKESRDLLTANDYLPDFQSHVSQLTKGVKDLPRQVMRPVPYSPENSELVYRRSELVAALKKAGVKPKPQGGGTSNTNYAALERARQARERIKKTILKAAIDPIRAAASKRNAKIPWPLFIVTMAGWTAAEICRQRGWKADYNTAGKVLAEKLAKMPENQMPGLVSDILINKVTTAHTGSYQPEFVQLGNFYGVDVKALEKAAKAKLEPEKEPATKVQTPGKKKTKPARKSTKGLTALARKKLTEAMKARWAARRRLGRWLDSVKAAAK